MDQTRRRYLLALAGSGAVGLAGCSGTGSETPTGSETATEGETPTEGATPTATETATSTDDDSGSQQSADVPRWTSWVPADLVVSEGYRLVAADVEQVRDQFPFESKWDRAVRERANSYGVDPPDLTHIVTIENDGRSATVVTGSFDPEAVRSHLDVSASETDSYREFTVVDGSTAVGEMAIVENQYQSVLDTRFGSKPALGTTDDDWTPLLSTLVDGAVVTAEPGYDGGASFSTDPLRHGYTINAGIDDLSKLTGQFLFASTSQASSVYERDQTELEREFGSNGRSLRRLEQRGRRIVVVTDQATFDF